MIQKKTAVFFDFDGTLTSKDSFLEFIKFTDNHFKILLYFVLHLPIFCLYFLNLYPNNKLKENIFSFFYKGKQIKEIESKGTEFCKKKLSKIIYSNSLKVIQWHKENDHQVYILTASSHIWLNDWCKENNLMLIGTTFKTKNGYYTGKIKGENCYGKEKLNQISVIIKNDSLIKSFGYGNSPSDKYYLNKVNKKFIINSKNKSVSQVNQQWLDIINTLQTKNKIFE